MSWLEGDEGNKRALALFDFFPLLRKAGEGCSETRSRLPASGKHALGLQDTPQRAIQWGTQGRPQHSAARNTGCQLGERGDSGVRCRVEGAPLQPGSPRSARDSGSGRGGRGGRLSRSDPAEEEGRAHRGRERPGLGSREQGYLGPEPGVGREWNCPQEPRPRARGKNWSPLRDLNHERGMGSPALGREEGRWNLLTLTLLEGK